MILGKGLRRYFAAGTKGVPIGERKGFRLKNFSLAV
jgi:hypothetical protein